MTRAPKLCNVRHCTNLRPCPTPGHEPEPWGSSTRRTRTVSGSRQQKRARHVLYLHRGICHVCLEPGADEVDHVISLAEGGPDELDNMRPIHAVPCHRDKTREESRRGPRTA